MIDISNRETLEKYLLERGVIDRKAGYSFKYCGGGVSCTVAFVYAGDKPMIVKQGLAQLKVKDEWLCDPNRMNIEYESNRVYHRLVPDAAPEVYFYDPDNYVYGREAVPEDWRMWKADLLGGLLDFEAARKAIRAMSEVHRRCAFDPAVQAAFQDKDIFYNLRVSPYLEFVLGKYPDLEGFMRPVIRLLMDSAITLVHGDFSPKNIMTKDRRISILDYEVAHFGHPAFDLAFFSTHFVLKAVKSKQWAVSYLNMLSDMMDLYFDKVDFMPASELESAYTRVWALIILARVDGKSPAEYITEEEDKALLRRISRTIIDEGIERRAPAIDRIRELVLKAGGRTND